MAAIPINLKIDKGADFSAVFTLTDEYGEPINLNSHIVISSFSNSYISTNKQNFTVNIINSSDGIIELKLSAVQTSLLKLPRYVYDVILIAPINIGGSKIRVIEGILEVSPGVS